MRIGREWKVGDHFKWDRWSDVYKITRISDHGIKLHFAIISGSRKGKIGHTILPQEIEKCEGPMRQTLPGKKATIQKNISIIDLDFIENYLYEAIKLWMTNNKYEFAVIDYRRGQSKVDSAYVKLSLKSGDIDELVSFLAGFGIEVHQS